jgi:hypothetical protein
MKNAVTAHKVLSDIFWAAVYVILILYVAKYIWLVLKEWRQDVRDWTLTRKARRALEKEWGDPYNGRGP